MPLLNKDCLRFDKEDVELMQAMMKQFDNFHRGAEENSAIRLDRSGCIAIIYISPLSPRGQAAKPYSPSTVSAHLCE